jgi:predicted nucleotide-binding protein (sugar kinase/HSP70/actin superfamily)
LWDRLWACPRFHTKSNSACPGCGGLNFKEKHPSCGFLTCCVIKKGLEVCSDCNDYPCKRFDSEKDGFDSFVTHKKVFSNLDFIKSKGIDLFIDNQKIRIGILTEFLTNFDDGRSKSFFCVSCALLPLDKLKESHDIVKNYKDSIDIKIKNKRLREFLLKTADTLEIDLKLNTKK